MQFDYQFHDLEHQGIPAMLNLLLYTKMGAISYHILPACRCLDSCRRHFQYVDDNPGGCFLYRPKFPRNISTSIEINEVSCNIVTQTDMVYISSNLTVWAYHQILTIFTISMAGNPLPYVLVAFFLRMSKLWDRSLPVVFLNRYELGALKKSCRFYIKDW